MPEKVLTILGGLAVLAAVFLYAWPRLRAERPTAPPEPTLVGTPVPGPRATPRPEAAEAMEAMRLAEAGDPEAGLGAIRASIEKHGPTVLNRTALGFVHLRRKDPEAATQAFESALADEPSFALALAGRGLVRMGMHRFEEAAADLGRAVAAEPGEPEWQRARASALLAAGRTAEALESARAAAEIAPDAASLGTLADCLLRAGRELEAVEVYRRIEAEEAPSREEAEVRERLSGYGVNR